MKFYRTWCLTLAAATALAVGQTLAEGEQKIVLAGGCFWGMEAVYDHVKGVVSAVPGYSGGEASTAQYETVSTGTTGHAESVQVTYDPKQISLEQILKIYFVAAHNPTQLNYQYPDEGTQYRSAIFVATPEQKKIAEAVIEEVNNAHTYPLPIVTQLEPYKGFYPAESYHLHYAAQHPDNPYIATYDLPRVANVKKDFPALYVEKQE